MNKFPTMTAQRPLPVTRGRFFLSCRTACLIALLAVLTGGSPAGTPIRGSSGIPRPVKIHESRALEGQLVAWDRQQKRAARNCNQDMAAAREQRTLKGEYDLTYKVLLDTPEIFSVKVDLDIYCGGAHPDEVHGGVMFDPRSGKQLNPFQMFDVATKHEYGYELNPDVKEIVKHSMLEKLDTEQIAQGCIPVLEAERFNRLDNSNAVLGTDGLHIMYPSARVVQYCYCEVILTNEQLQVLLKSSLLTRQSKV